MITIGKIQIKNKINGSIPWHNDNPKKIESPLWDWREIPVKKIIGESSLIE